MTTTTEKETRPVSNPTDVPTRDQAEAKLREAQAELEAIAQAELESFAQDRADKQDRTKAWHEHIRRNGPDIHAAADADVAEAEAELRRVIAETPLARAMARYVAALSNRWSVWHMLDSTTVALDGPHAQRGQMLDPLPYEPTSPAATLAALVLALGRLQVDALESQRRALAADYVEGRTPELPDLEVLVDSIRTHPEGADPVPVVGGLVPLEQLTAEQEAERRGLAVRSSYEASAVPGTQTRHPAAPFLGGKG